MMMLAMFFIGACHLVAASQLDIQAANFRQSGVPGFTLEGDSQITSYGFYNAFVYIGTPRKLYKLLVDTGSDVSWIKCATNATNEKVGFYDVTKSTTASKILCGDDQMCRFEYNAETCHDLKAPCTFTVSYRDHRNASGNFVSDTLHFGALEGNSVSRNSSARLFFGCGSKTNCFIRTDGILGLSPKGASMINQLYWQEKSALVFFHCLKGTQYGGGYLIFGQPQVPNLTYTPFLPSELYYYVEMQSISVDGKALPIDSSAFSFSRYRGTIVDSGTTLAALVAEAFDPLIAVISKSKSLFPAPWSAGAYYCYVEKEIDSLDVFPSIELKFAEGASMVLGPEDYLVKDGQGLMCVGFQRSNDLTILGDTVLKDKIIVYDLSSHRIGWSKRCDCSNTTFSVPSRNFTFPSGRHIIQMPFSTVMAAVVFTFLLMMCV